MKEYLDIREINGYSMQYTPFQPSPSWLQLQDESTLHEIFGRNDIITNTESSLSSISCLVYIGLPTNPQFLGPQDPQALAEKIVRSRGPSGENVEYLLKLEESLRELSAESEDQHVSDLARRATSFLERNNIDVPSTGHVFTDSKEEVEKDLS